MRDHLRIRSGSLIEREGEGREGKARGVGGVDVSEFAGRGERGFWKGSAGTETRRSCEGTT